MSRIALVILPLLLIGCAAPLPFPEEQMTLWRDRDTLYKSVDTEDGFKLYVWHERFQWFKSSAAIENTGKKALYTIADEIAEDRKKKIEEISERKIQSETGRTFWAMTSWSAVVRVFWKGAKRE